MSDSTQLFLAPCSREHKSKTYEHFQTTVVDGVDPAHYPTLKYAGFNAKIGVWGVVNGNRSSWKQLKPGDIILFYTKSGIYTHLAEVVDTEQNETLGEQLWTTYDGKRLVRDLEEPWPFLIYISNVQQVDIPPKTFTMPLATQ